MANKLWVGTTNAWGTAGNWSPSGVPGAGDNVRIDATSSQAIAGSDQSATALGAVEIDAGYTQTLGSAATYLKLTCSAFTYSGTGQAYIDLAASAIAPIINNTATPSTGFNGLYLKGSALTTLSVLGGDVGIATLLGETATVATVRVLGSQASVAVGSGVTLTTVYASKGNADIHCACTTINVYGGTVSTAGSGAVTTVHVYGGTFFPGSSGTITTLDCEGGTVDARSADVSFTASSVKVNPGGKFFYDPSTLTITAWAAPSAPIKISTSSG